MVLLLLILIELAPSCVASWRLEGWEGMGQEGAGVGRRECHNGIDYVNVCVCRKRECS